MKIANTVFYKLFRALSIKKRIVIIIIFCIMVPNILLMLFFISYAEEEFIDTMYEEYNTTVRYIEANVDEQISQVNKFMFDLVNNSDLTPFGSENEVEKYLEDRFEFFPENLKSYILNFSYVSKNYQVGIELSSTYDHSYVPDYDEFVSSSYYDTLDSNYTTWINTLTEKNVYLLRDNNNSYLFNYFSVFMQNPNFSGGHFVINISPNFFYNLYRDYTDINKLYLCKDDEMIIKLNNFYDIEDEPFTTQTSLVNVKYSEMFSGDYIVLKTSNIMQSWYILIVADKTKALENYYSLFESSLIVTAVILLLSVSLALVLSDSITRPIKKTINLISKTKIDSDRDESEFDFSRDEIGMLNKSYFDMLKRNNQLVNDLLYSEKEKNHIELERKQATLNALKMQINPHFLYNTLDIIRWNVILLERKRQENTSNMILLLSDMLRYGVNFRDEFTTISREIEHIKKYINLVNCAKNYRVELVLPNNLDLFSACKIVHLSFQPLVENAIVHGLKSNKLKICIKFRIKKGKLLISIYDNGKGVSKEKLDSINSQFLTHGRQGIGLKNVSNRIKLYFGEEYGIKIYSKQGVFTNISIAIPHENKE